MWPIRKPWESLLLRAPDEPAAPGGGSGAAEGGGEAPKPSTPPAPTFVPSEEFKTFQQTMSGMMGTLTETVGALRQSIDAIAAQRAASDRASDATAEITEQQFDEAVQTGNAAVIRKYMKQEGDRIRTQEIAPLRSQGLAAIGNLSKEMTVGRLPHYKRFQKEIDDSIARLPAELRMDPGTLTAIHNAIVGQHIEEIVNETKEAAIRQAATGGGTATPGGSTGGGRSATDTKIPSVVDLMGQDAADALDAVGRTPDQHAKRMGYKDWADYAAFVQRQRAGLPEPAAKK